MRRQATLSRQFSPQREPGRFHGWVRIRVRRSVNEAQPHLASLGVLWPCTNWTRAPSNMRLMNHLKDPLDDLGAGVLAQPVGEDLRGPVGQNIDDPVGFHINEEGSVGTALSESELVDTEYAQGPIWSGW